MRETGLVLFKGGSEKRKYELYARKLLGILKRIISKRESGWLSRRLPDGTTIKIYSIYGMDRVVIVQPKKKAGVTDARILAGFEVSTYLAELLGAYSFKDSVSCFIVVKGTLESPKVVVLEDPPDTEVDPADGLPHQPMKSAVDWSAPNRPLVTWFGEHRYKWRGPFSYGFNYPVAPLEYTDTYVLAGYEKETVFAFVMCEGKKYKIFGCVRGACVQVADGIPYLLVLYHADLQKTDMWSLKVFLLGNTTAKKTVEIYFPISQYFRPYTSVKEDYQYPCSHALFNADGTSAVFTQTVRMIDVHPDHPDSIWAEYYTDEYGFGRASYIVWDVYLEPSLGYSRPLVMVMGRVNVLLEHDTEGELVVTTDVVFPESNTALRSVCSQTTSFTPPDGRPTDDFDYTSDIVAGPKQAFLADFVGNSLAILKIKAVDTYEFEATTVATWTVEGEGTGSFCKVHATYDESTNENQTQSIVINIGGVSRTIFSRACSFSSSIAYETVSTSNASESWNTLEKSASVTYNSIDLLHADLRYGFLTFLEYVIEASGTENTESTALIKHHGFVNWQERSSWGATVGEETFTLMPPTYVGYFSANGSPCIPVWGNIDSTGGRSYSYDLSLMITKLTFSPSAIVHSSAGKVIAVSYLWDGMEPYNNPSWPHYILLTSINSIEGIVLESPLSASDPIAFSAIILPNGRILSSTCTDVTTSDTPRTVIPFQATV